MRVRLAFDPRVSRASYPTLVQKAIQYLRVERCFVFFAIASYDVEIAFCIFNFIDQIM